MNKRMYSAKKKKKKKINYANRFVVILFVALTVNLAFYWLPDSFLGIPIKKVDLLSDIRILPERQEIDLLASILEEEEEDFSNGQPHKKEVSPKETDTTLSPPTPSDLLSTGQNQGRNTRHNASLPNRTHTNDKTPALAANESNTNFANDDGTHPYEAEPHDRNTNRTNTDNISINEANINSTESPTRAHSNARQRDERSTDYLFNTHIEDFTAGHTGLRRFFAALNNINNLGRPVRIAFVGDSFIEGDIMVADFRAKLQERFGGRGVGFIPIASNVSQYRPTIKQNSDGWKTYSIIHNKSRKYVLSGLVFEPTSNSASVRFQTVNMYPQLEEVSSLKFIYAKNERTDMLLKSDSDTTLYKLQPTESVTQHELKGHFTKGTLQFRNTEGLCAIGLALEDDQGVIVDNFSLRGNSGIIMSNLDSKSCRELQQIRPYDLIVLQYGLNVASDSVREYGWYRNKMVTVIEHIQDCFPGADILLLGVSDRSHKQGSSYSTMPAVLSLLRAQRQTAKRTEVAFWSIFAAMGGQNSMVKYVNANWASKDYTHLSFRGGREIANALYDAIITEKGMYDGEEKLVER